MSVFYGEAKPVPKNYKVRMGRTRLLFHTWRMRRAAERKIRKGWAYKLPHRPTLWVMWRARRAEAVDEQYLAERIARAREFKTSSK